MSNLRKTTLVLVISMILFLVLVSSREDRAVAASAVKLPALDFLELAGLLTDRAASHNTAGPVQEPCPGAEEPGLPLPSSLPPDKMIDFQKRVFDFLDKGQYLSWCKDKGVRDTGPYINNIYYGTHPAVRVYYSPRIIDWLNGDRENAIPDGAMIIKEQYKPPATRYVDMTEAMLVEEFAKSKDWTIMIKDAAGSKDGWYWGEFYPGMQYDATIYPFNYPAAGFGQYCLRCHASADKESTFAALNNIKGFPGQPLSFRVDNSWQNLAPQEKPLSSQHRRPARVAAPNPPLNVNAEFLELFKSIPRVDLREVEKLPPETLDRVVSSGKGPEQFLTSDQCMMCHSAATGPYGPVMFLQTGLPLFGVPSGFNVSPYGEWRWSPMGLAGRDPVFYSQLESEIEILKSEFKEPGPVIQATVNTCLSCHGGMGKRQFDIDRKNPWADFKLEYTMITNPADPNFKYGSLARDGISCTMCHHVVEDAGAEGQSIKYFLENSITGQFQMGKPDEIFGPFKNELVSTIPMENALGIKPRHSEYVKSSRLCGSCHAINLPNVDDPLKPGDKPTVLDRIEKNPVFKPFRHSIEQATYLEWLNSEFQTEFRPDKSKAKSCQECHMPGGFQRASKKIDIKQLQQQIAIVEDDTYPAAENRAPLDKIRVRLRNEGYVRHELLGLNAFLLEMFNQFNDVLGVRRDDYMSGSKTGLPDAIANAVQQAREKTADVEVSSLKIDGNTLLASVKVTNKTGHRMPSGVGFRRSFLEFLIIETKDGRDQVIWSSGRTNRLGVIIDGQGKILPSEFFTEYRQGNKLLQHYQRHHQKITSQDQVQIYEELVQDAKGRFTTSFIHRDTDVKDNRLLPRGWSRSGPDPSIPHEFIEATFPKGEAAQDPQYLDGSGTDIVNYEIKLPAGVDPANITVQATLYSQSIPPAYLEMRFKTAPRGVATRRLYFLASNLVTEGTAIENWKLRIASARLRWRKQD